TERFQPDARGAGRRALQGDLLEHPCTLGRSLGRDLLRGILHGPEDLRLRNRLGILRGVEPSRESPSTRRESCRRLPGASRRRDARQIVVKRGEVVEGVAEAYEPRALDAEIERLERE